MIERSGPWVAEIEVPQLHDATTIRRRRVHLAGNRDATAALSGERSRRRFECGLAAVERVFRHWGHIALRSWRFAQDAKMQSVVVTALAREAVARGADWIVPIDGDEFPLLPSRAALAAALSDGPPVRRWSWRNVWPSQRAGFQHFAAAGTHDSVRSAIGKVLFRSEIARSGGQRFTIGTGSHAVTPTPEPPEPIGELVHIPLRHIDRVALKITINVANEAKRPGRKAHENQQYGRGAAWLDRFREPGGEAAMRRFALFYPHIPLPRDVARVEPLVFAPLGRLEGLPAPLGFEEVLAREAELAWEPLPEGDHALWRLRLDGPKAWIVEEPA